MTLPLPIRLCSTSICEISKLWKRGFVASQTASIPGPPCTHPSRPPGFCSFVINVLCARVACLVRQVVLRSHCQYFAITESNGSPIGIGGPFGACPSGVFFRASPARTTTLAIMQVTEWLGPRPFASAPFEAIGHCFTPSTCPRAYRLGFDVESRWFSLHLLPSHKNGHPKSQAASPVCYGISIGPLKSP